MTDREKVINCLANCPRLPFDLCFGECQNCDCQYYDELGIKKLHHDVLAILKEQEPKTVRSIRTVAQKSYGYCPSCGRGLDSYRDRSSGEHITHFCYNCGQKVKWDECSNS